MSAVPKWLVPAVAVVYVLGLVMWMGGLTALGAIVAPTVFRIVPAPGSADAMTVVFRKFDAVAIASGIVCLGAEATLAVRGGPSTRLDVARGIAVVAATALALLVGTWLSPGISELHRGGAIRGLGESGHALERLHGLAEGAGKGQLLLLFFVLVLLMMRVGRAQQT